MDFGTLLAAGVLRTWGQRDGGGVGVSGERQSPEPSEMKYTTCLTLDHASNGICVVRRKETRLRGVQRVA